MTEKDTQDGWTSSEDSLPCWDDGKVLIRTTQGKEYDAIFNELGWWWRVYTKDGIVRIEDEVVFWKKK